MSSQRAWIVMAAVGWALAIFAGGILLGMQLGDDEAGSESASPRDSGEAAAGVGEGVVAGHPARAAPLRVSLRDVRGELAIGPEGDGSGRDSGRSRPGGAGPGGAVLATRSGGSGARRGGAVPASAPAAPRVLGGSPGTARPVRRGAGGRRGGRRGGTRRPHRRRSPVPPAAPIAPALPPAPPAGDGDRHRGRGHGHDDDGHRGHGHDTDDDHHGRGHDDDEDDD